VQRFLSYEGNITVYISDNSIDFDCEYLWNRITDQAIDNRYELVFSTFGENNYVNFGPLTKK